MSHIPTIDGCCLCQGDGFIVDAPIKSTCVTCGKETVRQTIDWTFAGDLCNECFTDGLVWAAKQAHFAKQGHRLVVARIADEPHVVTGNAD